MAVAGVEYEDEKRLDVAAKGGICVSLLWAI